MVPLLLLGGESGRSIPGHGNYNSKYDNEQLFIHTYIQYVPLSLKNSRLVALVLALIGDTALRMGESFLPVLEEFWALVLLILLLFVIAIGVPGLVSMPPPSRNGCSLPPVESRAFKESINIRFVAANFDMAPLFLVMYFCLESTLSFCGQFINEYH